MANVLANSPAEVVGQMLQNLGAGSDPELDPQLSWPVYVAEEFDTPDDSLTVFDTAGRVLGRNMIDGSLVDAYGLQLRVRSKDHPTGWTKADAVRKALAENSRLVRVTVDSNVYLVWCADGIGPIIALGNALKSKRKLFTVNFTASIKQL